MSAFKPKGRPYVIPRIVTADVPAVVAFVKQVLRAKGAVQQGAPTELRVGKSVIMVSDGGGMREPMAAFLYVYVANVDKAHARAIKAGAKTLDEPEDMPWGDRRATVRDPWGNIWQIATHLG